MLTWRDIPGQTLTPIDSSWTLPLAPEPLVPAWSREQHAAAADRWAALKRENPRYHDGPLLAVTSISAEDRAITLARGSFRPMAVQHEGLELEYFGLGVKGLIVGKDRAGLEHVLIARRGPETRIYQSMWEIAPAGGIEPPASSATGDVPMSHVLACLHAEAEEELGLNLRGIAGEPVAIVQDRVAHSCDVIVRLAWPEPINPRASICRVDSCAWEYIDSAWLARPDAAGFDREHARAIVGPARAALRHLGWT